jgi:opacity protein-like surface antigen
MKKLLLSATISMSFLAVEAAQVAHEEPAVAVEPSGEPECQCHIGNFYIAGGIGGSFYKHDKGAITKNDLKKTNRFIGTVAVGGGHAFSSGLYLGGELMCDFSKESKKEAQEAQGGGNFFHKLKVSGFVPSVGVRLGYFNHQHNLLFYGKLAASRTKMNYDYEDRTPNYSYEVVNVKSAKFSPALALGVEKAFSSKISIRLEGEYRFASKGDGGIKTCKGGVVRALAAYNI